MHRDTQIGFIEAKNTIYQWVNGASALKLCVSCTYPSIWHSSFDFLPDVPPRILGSEMSFIVDQPHNVTCLMKACCKDDITVTWTLGGNELPGPHPIDINGDNSNTFMSKLHYAFTVGDEGLELVCVVGAACIDTYQRVPSSASTVDVYCECFLFLWNENKDILGTDGFLHPMYIVSLSFFVWWK